MALPENPLTRRETYLAKAAGQSVTLPEEDLTREEQYLRAIAEGGGGGGVTKDYVDNAVNALDDAKVDKVEGKELSTNDYTDAEKTKLAGLSNYDDTALSDRVTAIETVVPSTATAQNKLSTATDVAGENISGSATGTAITLTDSADARVQGLTIKGRSHKSKNLLEITAETQTINGVTFTVDKVAGTITANGTATSFTKFNISNKVYAIMPNYVLTGCPSGGNYANGYSLIGWDNDTQDTGIINDGNSSEFSKGSQNASYGILLRSGTVANNLVFKPMICTAADYEADPSFEPYGIHSVGDDGLTVQTTGKNLVNPSTLRNGYYDQEGYIDNSDFRTSDLISVKSNTEYVASMFSKNGDFISNLVYNEYDVNGELISAVITSSYITTSSNTAFIRVRNYHQDREYITNNNFVYQLELGSTATAYEPYRSTSADYTTGLPLCSITDTTIHDELNAGKEVVKQCGVMELDDLTFAYADSLFSAAVTGAAAGAALCEKYTYKAITSALSELADGEFTLYDDSGTVKVYINDTNYSDAATFTTAVAGVNLIYPLETPTTTPLTDTEISAFRQLRTFDSTTNINIIDEPEYSIDYLKNTDNGEAVSRIADDLQGQINDKIVVSGTLTLTAAGWSNGAQTVSFAHNTSKRNVIDITPSEIPKWAQYGVYAVSETSAGITFNCASTPNEALTFKVTSMEVTV